MRERPCRCRARMSRKPFVVTNAVRKALALEHGVGGNRGAVREVLDRGDVDAAGEKGIEGALVRCVRHAWHLGHADAVRSDRDQVGERAADLYADALQQRLPVSSPASEPAVSQDPARLGKLGCVQGSNPQMVAHPIIGDTGRDAGLPEAMQGDASHIGDGHAHLTGRSTHDAPLRARGPSPSP